LRVRDNQHPATAARAPHVIVDELNWAHVVYEEDGGIFKARHLYDDVWYIRPAASGQDPALIPFYNEKELILWGQPTNTYWFGAFMASRYEGAVRVHRFLSWFNVWEPVATFPLPPGEEWTGPAGLAFRAVSEEEAWVYVAWVTRRPAPPPPPAYAQPAYEAANPLYPTQIANPDQIYQGLNAARWGSAESPFAAGLMQTAAVTDTSGAITFSAWGRTETAAGADIHLRLGIDPRGGDDPASPDVVWSAAAAPSPFTSFSVSVPAAGDRATFFLDATQNAQDIAALAIWDAAAAENAALDNGDFEAPFTGPNGRRVPNGWTAYDQDQGGTPAAARDVYTVYAAWSEDGGSTWTGPAAITANRSGSGGVTGALRPAVYPVITPETETPSVSFIYIYETGDPPPGSDFIRFGRPHMTVCELGAAECSDPPGAPLLPRNAVRPTTRLALAPDPFQPGRALLGWDGLQRDAARRDIYASYLTLR
jgi:hypothetical protein